MRRLLICESEFPVCPGCDKPLARTTIPAAGGLLATCGRLASGTARCEAHYLLVGVGAGLTLAILLSPDEARGLQPQLGQQLTPVGACQALRLLRRRLVLAS